MLGKTGIQFEAESRGHPSAS